MDEIPVVILCGGSGTRMGDTRTKKELIDIGGRPLLWHVMRIFSAYNHKRFIMALGFNGDQVRQYFSNNDFPSWEVELVDTGTLTRSGVVVEKGSRLAKVAQYLTGSRFFVAYGEAVADIDLDDLVAFHIQHGRLATVAGARVNFQYGVFESDDNGRVLDFVEKPLLPYWINGGFMLFEQSALELVRSESNLDLERQVLPQLAREGELMLYRHSGYWQSMKTLKDASALKEAWEQREAWKVWDE